MATKKNNSPISKSRQAKTKIREILDWDKYLDAKASNREVDLKARDVNIFYKTKLKPFHAVKNVSLNLYEGEVLGLVGESGSGKSTFGKAVTKQIDHVGLIEVKDIELPEKASHLTPDKRTKLVKNIQMIFQDPTDSLNPYHSVKKNVMEGINNIQKEKMRMLKENNYFGKWEKRKENKKKEEFIRETIHSVGFDNSIMRMYPLELSGGQQQRVSIARALLVEPEIIVADEPISALDVSIQAQVINILNELKKERQLTILFIAHDLRMVEYISTRIAIMNQGRLVEILPAREIDNQAIHPYTLTLLSAVPSIDEFDINLLKRSHDPSEYQVSDESSWWEIEDEHYVFGTEEQIIRWKKEALSGGGK